ncbi:MAG TPA: hypothetical protein VJP59_05015 [Gemmatimonadota bacterium]|nr:hypothetical protein [Gemmatimonadota bacterium]
MALVTLLPWAAVAQDFSAQISPNPVRLVAGGASRSVTVSTTASGGFTVDIFYSFTGFPSGISTGGTQTSFFPYPPLTFVFAAASDVPRGTYTGSLVGTSSLETHSFPMTVIVERPDFSLSAMPPSVSVERGGTTSVTVTALPIDGFGGTVSVVSPSLSGLTFDPASFELPAGGSRAVTITASETAAIGPIVGAFVGTASGIAGRRAASIRVEVTGPAPPPPPAEDFSLTASPMSLSVAPGGSGVVNVSATGIGGFAGSISVSAGAAGALEIQPASFSLQAGASQAVSVTADASAPAGTTSLVFTGTAAGIPGSRTAAASVTVTAPSSQPLISAITPPSVVTGTTDNRLRITGQNFQPGATIASISPGVTVTSAQVLGPGAAEVVVAVRPDARPGPYQLALTNPDGGTATGGAMLLVYPAGSLSAPLAVTAAAIVAPRPWQILEPGQAVHAQALLATSGMGTVVGTWLLDGVPFDRFTRVVASGYPVEVRSLIPIPLSFTGEHRLELVIESPPSLPPREVPFFQATESRTALKVLEPDSGAVIDPEAPSFRWTLVPGASGYEVEIEDAVDAASDARPWTAFRRRVTDTDWRPDQALLELLGPGPKRFRVRAVFPGEVLGEPTPWVLFTLPGDGGASEAPPGATGWRGAPVRLVSSFARSPTRRLRFDPAVTTPEALGVPAAGGPVGAQDEAGSSGQLGLSLMSTTSTIASDFEDPPPLTRLQLSTQTDFRGPAFEQQATADLSGSHDLEDPWGAREESRNWLTRLGATQGGFREEFAIGFAPPSFFDQTEFLTVATSGGALQGTFGTPAGRLAYYRSVDLSANGSFSAFEPDIDAAAYQASDEAGRFLFRTMWLEVTDPEVEGFSAGGEGKALGMIGVAHLRPWLRLLGEAAGGDFDPGEGGFEEDRDGRAFRFGVDGTAGTFGYAFTVGRTGEGFVNPANRGFTPGGISDRTRAELSLNTYFGQASLSGAYRHVRGGIHEAAGDPETTENGASVRLAAPIGQRVSLSVGGNVVGQEGDPVDEFGLPETDRTQRGADLSFSETVGPFSLTQALTWQDFTDQVQPLSDQTVTGVSFAAGGGLTSYLNLSANVATTRTEAAPEIGTTNQLLLSLQPALAIDKLWLAVTPRMAWTRVDNDLDDSEFKTDQYQLVLRWSPPWAGALLNLEVASDWNRSWSHLDEPPSFDRQTVLTLTLNWRADRVWRAEPSLAERHEQIGPAFIRL